MQTVKLHIHHIYPNIGIDNMGFLWKKNVAKNAWKPLVPCQNNKTGNVSFQITVNAKNIKFQQKDLLQMWNKAEDVTTVEILRR